MAKTRVVIIDPIAHTVTEDYFEWDGKDYEVYNENIYSRGQFNIMEAVMFADYDDTLMVDEEGTFKEGTGIFAVRRWPHPIHGRGVVVGSRGEDSISATMTIHEVEREITWMT